MATENQIAKALFDKAKTEHGHAIIAEDDWTTDAIKDFDTFLDNAKSVETPWAYFYDDGGKFLGAFLLIWGNGDDLISNHTSNEWSEGVFNHVTRSLGLI